MNVKVKIWIENEQKDLIFGSGKTEVLKQIDSEGSLEGVAIKAGMDIEKVKKHIQILQRHIEDELIHTNGGEKEKEVSLSPKAREIIQTYEILEYDIKKYAKKRFRELFLSSSEEIIKAKTRP